MNERIIKLAVDISCRALDKTPSFALKVLEHILMTRLPDQPEYSAYSEAVKELHGMSSHELRRLAVRYADYFSVRLLIPNAKRRRIVADQCEQTFYDVLEPKIREITMANQMDDKLQMELTSVLVIITYAILMPLCFILC